MICALSLHLVTHIVHGHITLAYFNGLRLCRLKRFRISVTSNYFIFELVEISSKPYTLIHDASSLRADSKLRISVLIATFYGSSVLDALTL